MQYKAYKVVSLVLPCFRKNEGSASNIGIQSNGKNTNKVDFKFFRKIDITTSDCIYIEYGDVIADLNSSGTIIHSDGNLAECVKKL